MDKEFQNKVAFITGGSTGIGRATAIAFAKQGAKVVIADVQEAEAQKTVSMIKDLNQGAALFVPCDVSKDSQVASAIQTTVKTFGRLDFAFNNAGIEGEPGPTADCTAENWDQVIQVNLKGVWLCMKYEIPEMLKHGCGSIVNCSSIAGLRGFPGLPAYVASKHAVVGLTKSAALEYAQLNLRVNAVCPGVIQTPMIDRFTHGDPKAEQGFIQAEPMGRLGQPEEIAGAVLWLCSSSASFTTGQAIAVDGGWTAK